MLSYQHIYHAGNLADCHKHAALCLLLENLPKKASYFETHAARGFYDLNSKEAQKTAEAEEGIKTIINKTPPEDSFIKIQNKIRAEKGDNFYAASPYIAKHYLGLANLHLCELHPQEFAALKANMAGAKIYNEDGYKQVLKLIPPMPRDGLLLVDPSYEIKTEYEQAAEFVLKAHKKWQQGIILLWYPILEAGLHKAFDALGGYKQEILFKNPKRMLGSGIIILNIPENVQSKIEEIPQYLTPNT